MSCYWGAAIEYADSVGGVNTSLYYTGSRWSFPSHEYESMDGRTAFPTRAANVAANKGISRIIEDFEKVSK